MEIPGTLQLQANVLHLALVATEGTEIVDKVMRNSWKDRPPFPFKGHCHPFCSVQPHDKLPHRDTSNQPLQSSLCGRWLAVERGRGRGFGALLRLGCWILGCSEEALACVFLRLFCSLIFLSLCCLGFSFCVSALPCYGILPDYWG